MRPDTPEPSDVEMCLLLFIVATAIYGWQKLGSLLWSLV